MEKTRAWELLNDPNLYGKLTAVGVRDLMLQAGYSPDAAQRALNEHGMYRLNNNMVL